MLCKVCSMESNFCFSEKVMGKYNVDYYHCLNCDFIQTEDPYWLEEAYSRSINLSDTGYMVRNQYYASRFTVLLYMLFGKKGRYLDYAGGYGVFVRMMRDIGFDFIWDDKYTHNMFASGFEWDQKSRVDAVTLFEVFEHFVQPMDEIGKLLKISDTIIFSTELHPDPVPEPKDWWYYGLDHGQHISFYSKSTLEFIAKKYELNYYSIGSLHILTNKNISGWALLATRLSKLGMHKIFAKKLTSKTMSDYDFIIKAGKE